MNKNMSYKKILILSVVIILVAVGLGFFLQGKTAEAPIGTPMLADPNDQSIGEDRDGHGCIGSAGYSWCEGKGECLRPWEDEWDDSCEVEVDDVSNGEGAASPPLDGIDLITCTLEAKTCSDGSAVGRIAPDCEFEKCPSEM